MTSTATVATASSRSRPGSWARKHTTSSSIPMPMKTSRSTQIRPVAPSEFCVAMVLLASERKETVVYQSASRRTPTARAQPTTTATGTAAPTTAASAHRRVVPHRQLPGDERTEEQHAAEHQPAHDALLEADGEHREEPRPERVACRDPAYGPQREPARHHHERDAEDLALGGHRVDLRVAHQCRGPHRRPTRWSGARRSGRRRRPAGRSHGRRSRRRARGGRSPPRRRGGACRRRRRCRSPASAR